MQAKILFQCPSCMAKIKAPAQLIGQRRNCPGCGNSFLVREQPSRKANSEFYLPGDSDPMLVSETDTVEMAMDSPKPQEDQAKRLAELEAENARLKKLLADLAKTINPGTSRVSS